MRSRSLAVALVVLMMLAGSLVYPVQADQHEEPRDKDQNEAQTQAQSQEAQEEEASTEGFGSGVITFYGHVFGHGLDASGSFSGPMPSNTEAPIGEDNYGIGTGSDCGFGIFGECDSPSEGWNKLALFSTAGFVDVDNRAEFDTEGRYSLLHNERGQTQDIRLDTDQSIEAGAYISLDMHGWPVGVLEPYGSNCIHPHPQDVPCVYPYWGWDPGIAEDVVVEAILYKARLGDYGGNASEAPPIEESLLEGEAEVFAEGQWGPDTVMNGIPGAPKAQHFQIDLGPSQVDQIPKEEDFFIVYTVYQETAGEKYFLDGDARWWAGEFFPPTYTMPTLNAFTVERVVPEFAHGKMAVLGILNTPWGSYDVDPDSVELQVEGPQGELTPEQVSTRADFSVAHGGHFKPVNKTWIWDYQAQDLRSGEYELTVTGTNFQGSAEASCQATVTLEGGNDGLVPGETDPGTCGAQTITDDLLEQLKAGAREEAEEEEP